MAFLSSTALEQLIKVPGCEAREVIGGSWAFLEPGIGICVLAAGHEQLPVEAGMHVAHWLDCVTCHPHKLQGKSSLQATAANLVVQL